jgi:peptidoglycan-N-acetylglucosamine deacetylase
MNSLPKPVASVSLDLDDKWTYMKTRGMEGWQRLPSYLEIVVPRVLTFLKERSLRITFFLVGQDAALARNETLLRSIADAGHEIGNHSFHHEPWLHLYSRSEIERELSLAEENIERVTGRRLRGFRGPGYSISDMVREVLAVRGYQYDASTLPTFLGPPARAYYFLSSRLSSAQRKQRGRLYGSWRDGLRPLAPHRWGMDGHSILEIPVTTMPVFRAPFHLSYLIWIASYSHPLSRAYLRTALMLCRSRHINPSFLLHPLDFLDYREAPELGFFPGMKVPLQQKLEIAGFTLARLADRHRIVTLGEHASEVEAAGPDRIPAVARELDGEKKQLTCRMG